jgi:serine/threonine protein kinase
LQAGALLGQRYLILSLLGQGGMGAVYKAHDRTLGRDIALKVIRPDFAANPEVLHRFKQEIILARQVTHRNVVRIYDLGEADGVQFITMEYVEGDTLRGCLRERSKLPPTEAVAIMRQMLAGLGAVHEQGILHRDLKPGNVMIDPAGRLVLMDFGLARALQSDGMTQSGAVIGTMEYMSPEQATGVALDARSDLFTAGLIFYELLTGVRPYEAESAIASLVKRTRERATPASDIEQTVPRGE